MWSLQDSWESLEQQGSKTSQSWRKSILNIHWKDGCWSWKSNPLATRCEQLTHWKRPWCWARLKAGGEGDDRGWDGWMASLTQWTWVWASSGRCWRTGKPCSPWGHEESDTTERLNSRNKFSWTADFVLCISGSSKQGDDLHAELRLLVSSS